MPIQNLTGEAFDILVKEGRPMLVDFWAPWCGPCRVLGKLLDEVAAERTDVQIFKVNIDDEPDLANRLSISSIPTLMGFTKGQSVSTSRGVPSKSKLTETIDSLLSH